MAPLQPAGPGDTPASEAAREPHWIDHDLPCAGCGYNLRGLRTGGACPECGLAIAQSMRSGRLHLADPRWLGRVRAGLGLLRWAVDGWLLLLVALILGQIVAAAPRGPGAVHSWVGDFTTALAGLFALGTALAPLLAGVGVLLATWPEPRVPMGGGQAAAHRARSRRWLGAVALLAVAAVGVMVVEAGAVPIATPVMLLALLGAVGRCVWTFSRWLESLARRATDYAAAISAMTTRKLGWVVVGLLAVGPATMLARDVLQMTRGPGSQWPPGTVRGFFALSVALGTLAGLGMVVALVGAAKRVRKAAQ